MNETQLVVFESLEASDKEEYSRLKVLADKHNAKFCDNVPLQSSPLFLGKNWKRVIDSLYFYNSPPMDIGNNFLYQKTNSFWGGGQLIQYTFEGNAYPVTVFSAVETDDGAVTHLGSCSWMHRKDFSLEDLANLALSEYTILNNGISGNELSDKLLGVVVRGEYSTDLKEKSYSLRDESKLFLEDLLSERDSFHHFYLCGGYTPLFVAGIMGNYEVVSKWSPNEGYFSITLNPKEKPSDFFTAWLANLIAKTSLFSEPKNQEKLAGFNNLLNSYSSST